MKDANISVKRSTGVFIRLILRVAENAEQLLTRFSSTSPGRLWRPCRFGLRTFISYAHFSSTCPGRLWKPCRFGLRTFISYTHIISTSPPLLAQVSVVGHKLAVSADYPAKEPDLTLSGISRTVGYPLNCFPSFPHWGRVAVFAGELVG